MPYFFSIRGEMRVILCLKKASQIWELPEKNPGRRESRLMFVSMTAYNVISYNICGKYSIRLALPWASRSNLFPCSGGTQYLHNTYLKCDSSVFPAEVVKWYQNVCRPITSLCDLYKNLFVQVVKKVDFVSLPWFGLSKVQVIDTVEVHVLSVPCKRSLPHAKIQVGRIDTLDGDAAFTFNSIQNGV